MTATQATSSDVRPYAVQVRGFDMSEVHVKASSNRRARIFAAKGFVDAGFGDMRQALRALGSCRLYPPADGLEVIAPNDAGEGLCERRCDQ